MSRVLFICTTPLQVVLAKKIIQKKSILNADLLFLFYNLNGVYSSYLDAARQGSDFGKVYSLKMSSNSRIGTFFDLIVMRLFGGVLPKGIHSEVYLASVNNGYVQFFVSADPEVRIFTFDDGLANVSVGGNFYVGDKSFWHRLLKRLLGVRFDALTLAAKSVCHYTIYRNLPNISNNVRYLSLGPECRSVGFLGADKVKIFLGQPFSELGVSEKYYRSIIKRSGAQYYFPHPREQGWVSGLPELRSNLIFEDFLFSDIFFSDKSFLELHSVVSTVSLNLSATSNVKCFVYHNKYLMSKYAAIYDCMRSLGVSCIHWE